MPNLNIELSEKDVLQFQATLDKKGNILFTKTIPEGTDLSKIIREEVINYTRGDTNVD
jgi:hypothetical protein